MYQYQENLITQMRGLKEANINTEIKVSLPEKKPNFIVTIIPICDVNPHFIIGK